MMRWWRRGLMPGAVAIAVMLVAAVAAHAAAGPRNLFEVRNIKVDVVAATANQAREQALADGELRAFQTLLDRLTLPSDQATTRRFAATEIASATKDFWVSEEKVSTVRYIATLNYEFRGERVRELAAAKGISLVTVVAQPVMVVPTIDAPGGARLWPPGNPWWDAFASLDADGLVPLVMPTGDAEDAALIDAKGALAVDELRLAALARRHDVLDILVAIARPQAGMMAAGTSEDAASDAAAGPGQLTVEAKRKLTFGPVSETIETFRSAPGESVRELWKRAASATLHSVENAWKETNRGDGTGSNGAIAVDLPLRDMKTWLLVEKSLHRLPGVRRVDPVLFSLGRVRVNLFYSGTTEQVATALERAGFSVTPAGEFWIVRPVKALAPGAS